jgi:hypothetical protein
MDAEQKTVSRRAVGLVKSMRWILWVLLIASVVATLEGLPALREAARGGRVPPGLTLVPVTMMAVFIVGYAVYRFTLVRAGRYPAGKAMMQLALMSLFLAMMARWALDRDFAGRGDGPVDLGRALASGAPEVRALAAEVLRARPRGEALALAERLVPLLSDSSTEVRRQAHATLVALVGQDHGQGAGAAERWRAALAATR